MISAENGFALPVKWNLHRISQYAFAYTALFIFLLIIYSNSFYGDWHFDDYFNIVSNPYIQINDFSWDNIKKCIYGLAQERPSRPLSYLSFAVNYYFDGTNVFGYHVVNFAIHYLAAIFLYLFIFNTLQLPLLRDKFKFTAYPVALLAALFWAISPVWVTSVTYIVQRMASLAGLFYIMSLYFYLKGRTSAKFSSSVFFFIFCAAAGLAAVLSKENAAMLPVLIFLYDLLLIKGAGRDSMKKYLKIFFLPAAIIMIAAFIYVDFPTVFDGYKMRDFTPLQRMLTEPRVIIFYLSLLFFPVNSRLTLLYDIDISRSLMHPWTTLPAILLILAALGFAVYLAKRRPLFSFCIIFYFLNHLIEGSFFNLELIFEHRNYIPAMLLFLPAAILFISGLNYFSANRTLQGAVLAALIIILVGLGNETYRRNYIVSDDFRLWSDNNEKYPQLSRTHSNLGNAHLAQNRRQEALREYEKAMSLNNFGGVYARAVQEHNLGLYKYAEGKYDEALPYFVSSSKILPSYLSNTIHIARIHLIKNEFSPAFTLVQAALENNPRNSDLGELFCLILLRTKNFSQAENYAKSFLQSNLAVSFPLAAMAETARQKGNLPAAINLWKRYQNALPNDRLANLALVELYAARNDQTMLKKELAKLYCLQGGNLGAYIKEISGRRNLCVYFPDYNLIKKIINGSGVMN